MSKKASKEIAEDIADIQQAVRYHLCAINAFAIELDQEDYERAANGMIQIYKAFGIEVETNGA